MAAVGLAMLAGAVAITVHRGAPSTATAPVAPARQTTRVALYVQHDANALRVHWNPDAPEVADARKGAIEITDGAHRSRLDLRHEELLSGLASYWPDSRQVTFRLELDGAVVASIDTYAEAMDAPRSSAFARDGRKRSGAALADTRTPRRVTSDNEASRAAADPEPPKPRSRWRRVTGKIPLVRRLHRRD